MLPFYQTNLLQHLKPIHAWLTQRGADASVIMPGCVLRVQWRNRIFDFQPQFRSIGPDGAPTVWFELKPESTGFFGWLPYFNKRWPAARNKLAFKDFAAQCGIRTPPHGQQAQELDSVLIKQAVSSFGEGIRGPYRLGSLSEKPRLASGEFYERFITGRILKALYWNGRPVAVELYAPASVLGDGRRTIRELVDGRPRLTPRPVNEEIVRATVEFHGHSLEEIPQAGLRVQVDYRYGSALFDAAFHNTNTLKSLDPAIRNQIDAAGPLFELAIPESIRKDSAFSADAVVDDDCTVWFLEMNCNPHLHPDIYPAMLDSLFADADLIRDDLKPMHVRRTVPIRAPANQSASVPPIPLAAFGSNAASIDDHEKKR